MTDQNKIRCKTKVVSAQHRLSNEPIQLWIEIDFDFIHRYFSHVRYLVPPLDPIPTVGSHTTALGGLVNAEGPFNLLGKRDTAPLLGQECKYSKRSTHCADSPLMCSSCLACSRPAWVVLGFVSAACGSISLEISCTGEGYIPCSRLCDPCDVRFRRGQCLLYAWYQ